MIPDPNTKNGRDEIARRASKRKNEIEDIRKRALQDVESEPSGKMTIPSDLDRFKDRKLDHK